MNNLKRILTHNGYILATATVTSIEEIEVEVFELSRRQDGILRVAVEFKREIQDRYVEKYDAITRDGKLLIRTYDPDGLLESIFSVITTDNIHEKAIEELDSGFVSWFWDHI